MTDGTNGAPISAPAPVGDDVTKHKALAIVGYIIPLLFFIPMISEGKSSKYAMFHANQQLNLLILYAIGWVLMFVFIGMFVQLAGFILAIIGLINAAQGNMKPLPLIGGINLLNA